jgi:hypothetical protein
MKIRNWTACVQDREKWKEEGVERAIKGSSAPGRRIFLIVQVFSIDVISFV